MSARFSSNPRLRILRRALRDFAIGDLPHDRAWQRRVLLQAGSVDLVIDAGANNGGFVHELRGGSAYSGRVLSLEPGSAAFEQLRAASATDPGWEALQLALGDVTASAALTLPHGHSNLASLLPLSSGLAAAAAIQGTSTETIRVVRLDDLAHPFLETAHSFHLKIDVQGFEDKVLRGSSGMIERVVSLECELALSPMYEGQSPLVPSLKQILDLGFRPLGVHPNYADPQSGQIFDCDWFFVRNPSGS